MKSSDKKYAGINALLTQALHKTIAKQECAHVYYPRKDSRFKKCKKCGELTKEI